MYGDIMARQNCWEFFDCELEKQQICPAANDVSLDGKNGGVNGGRICWKINGVKCDEKSHGDKAKKMLICFEYAFFKKVQDEEGKSLEQNIEQTKTSIV